jgi:RNA-directed DNA polymerase
MGETDADRRAERPEDSRKVTGGTGERKEREHQASTAVKEKTQPEAERLLEEVPRRENMLRVLRRVRSNKGAPGIDGMTVEGLVPYLKAEWPRIREELLKGTYQPMPVRQVEIPKPSGKGKRPLGIPTVLDRMIQQAILQVLTPVFDSHFSDSSYGFRPGRRCQDAVPSPASEVSGIRGHGGRSDPGTGGGNAARRTPFPPAFQHHLR